MFTSFVDHPNWSQPAAAPVAVAAQIPAMLGSPPRRDAGMEPTKKNSTV